METLPARILGPALCGVALAAILPAQVTTRASVASDGSQFPEQSQAPSVSADGLRIAFVKGVYLSDVHSVFDVFARDRAAGTTVLVSANSSGAPGNANSNSPAISADGRFVAFLSLASDLVPGDANGQQDVFVRDLQTGAIERANLAASGGESATNAWWPSISADGRHVAFWSLAADLVAGDTNADADVFVRDRATGTTERVSVSGAGLQGNGASDSSGISRDGRWVVFVSGATNLVAQDANGLRDVFVRDRLLGTTELVSVATGGGQANGISNSSSISDDGRWVAFHSSATNLTAGDANGAIDAFVRDRTAQTTTRVSVDANGAEGNASSFVPVISGDGRFVAYGSWSSNLVPGDTNGFDDVFVHDRWTGGCERASVSTLGAQGDGTSFSQSISRDGRWVAFTSFSANLVAGDTNSRFDVFLRDRDATGFASLCEPGVGGALACPCSNPPSGPSRGCDNSAGTGGAVLSAAGVAYLSADSLVLTARRERPTALSLVLQGDAEIAGGTTYGQGVRCAGGTLKRLYAKVAVGGTIVAPDLAGGDPTVSARSAALGDPIRPGETRHYLVSYRDPVVLGGCLASSTFNATQTGRIAWQP